MSNTEGLTEKFNQEEFTHMMFLDGCFTLHYICNIMEARDKELKKIKQIALVCRDLLLLENQLPFIVLKVLMKVSFGIAEGNEMITAFIRRIRGAPPEAGTFMKQLKYFTRKHSISPPEFQMQDWKDEDDQPVHLLEVVQRQFINPEAFGIGSAMDSSWFHPRSAKNFMTQRIHLKPSKTDQFTDVEFKSTFTSGILTLPKIIIGKTTKSMLLNLAAYEACPDNENIDLGVTSYICLMGSIIDQEEDVLLLRSTGILVNYLGSDKQVADLFKEITTELTPSPHAYVQVKTSLENHNPNSIITWSAECFRTYFRSPSTSVAVSTAILAVALSVAQTFLAARQTYLTAHPPKD